MDEIFIQELDKLRFTLNFPLKVNSGYRCPEYNARVSNSGRNGPHTTGRAVDLGISGEDALSLIKASFLHTFTGIGVNQKGPVGGRFIHLDTLSTPEYPRPNLWSY